MSYETVRERIAELLLGIEGIENVHQYVRDIRKETIFKEAFVVRGQGQENDRVNGWQVSRTSFVEDYACMGQRHADRTHQFEITGYYSLNDIEGSELVFQDLIDKICDEFRGRDQLQDKDNNPLEFCARARLISGTGIGHATFGNYFVHSCVLSMEVVERLPSSITY